MVGRTCLRWRLGCCRDICLSFAARGPSSEGICISRTTKISDFPWKNLSLPVNFSQLWTIEAALNTSTKESDTKDKSEDTGEWSPWQLPFLPAFQDWFEKQWFILHVRINGLAADLSSFLLLIQETTFHFWWLLHPWLKEIVLKTIPMVIWEPKTQAEANKWVFHLLLYT